MTSPKDTGLRVAVYEELLETGLFDTASDIETEFLGQTAERLLILFKDHITELEGKLPGEHIQMWDDDDGFCQACEAFLEDDKYRCYCDVRNEIVKEVKQVINDYKEGL